MESTYSCPHKNCGRKFNSEKDLSLHMERRHKKFTKIETPKLPEIDYEDLFLEDGIYESVDEVEELVLTHKELQIFEPQKQIDTKILGRITILSLSHNKIQDIDFLEYFLCLEELNLNNNLIENLW